MKHLQLLLLGLFFIANAFSQIKFIAYAGSSNSKEIIRANKIIREERYAYIYEKGKLKDSGLVIAYYDTLGCITEEKSGQNENSIYSITQYRNYYDSLGMLLKQIKHNSKGLGDLINEYEYDSLGNEVIKSEYFADRTFATIEQKFYNNKNQVIQLRKKINNADFYISKQYYYNENNQLTKAEALDRNGEVIYSDIYEYNKPLNKKTVYLENTEGKKIMEEYIYNNDMQCVQENSILRKPVFISRGSTEYEYYERVTKNIYNADKTLSEANIYIENKKTQTNKYYYFKD